MKPREWFCLGARLEISWLFPAAEDFLEKGVKKVSNLLLAF